MSYTELAEGIGGSVLVILVVYLLFSEVVRLGLAPQPGEAMYPLWASLTSIGFRAVILSATGAVAVGFYLIEKSEF